VVERASTASFGRGSRGFGWQPARPAAPPRFRIFKELRIYRTGPLAKFYMVVWRDDPIVLARNGTGSLFVATDNQRTQARKAYLESLFWPVPLSAG
jgi:hypothetical protein